jgi:hypothetical protein
MKTKRQRRHRGTRPFQCYYGELLVQQQIVYRPALKERKCGCIPRSRRYSFGTILDADEAFSTGTVAEERRYDMLFKELAESSSEVCLLCYERY